MLEEQEIVERARRGDVAAYEDLVRRHQDVAFRVAFGILRDASDAEDAAQLGFIKAYRALDRFRPDAPFRPWLLKIVANEARNLRRSSGRRLRLAERAKRIFSNEPRDQPPEQRVLRDELQADVREALNELSEMDRLVISYRFFLELTEAEMAEVLDVPPGTVKSRLSRALVRLRKQLIANETEAPPDA